MKKNISFFLTYTILGLITASFQTKNQQIIETYIGPEKGYLVISGGGMDEPSIRKFISLTKKPKPIVVVIPTADSKEKYSESDLSNLKRTFEQAGSGPVFILHTRDTAEANSDEFVKNIRNADAVWFTGGRQWRLADAYLNTKVLVELNALLERGGVIGGNSAGASIQASFLVRGDSKSNLIMEGDHTKGFGFLKNSAIDQHLLQRNRHFDLLEIHHKYPELLCLGIDSETSLIVHGNEMEVFGEHYVSVYDGSFYHSQTKEIKHLELSSDRFYFLKPGDRYDLKRRRVYIK